MSINFNTSFGRALHAELMANLDAKPTPKHQESTKFRGLEMAITGRQVSFTRNGQTATYFIRANGDTVLLKSPRHRAFYPEMERHIDATLNIIAAKLARAA